MNILWHKIRADLRLYKSRTVLAVLSIAAGVFCVGTLFGMIDLQLGRMDAAHRASQPSHINLILKKDTDNALLKSVQDMPGVAGVDTMTQLTIRYRLPGTTEWSIGTLIVRPDYLAQTFDRTSLQAGNWPARGNIAIERLSAAAADLQEGDAVEFETEEGIRPLAINGIVRHPFVKPPTFGGQLHFFIDAQTAQWFGVKANSFRQLLVRIRPPYSGDKAREVARDIRLALNENKVSVNVTLLQDPNKHWGRPFFAGVNEVLQIMAMASLVLASVLILNTLSALITQQTDQIGVMKALGGGTVIIAKLYLLEALLMAMLAIVLATPSGLVAAHFSSCFLLDLFNIDCGPFDFSVRALTYMVLGGLIAPLLAALGPALRGATMTVRDAMASYGLGSGFGDSRLDRWIDRFGECFLPTLYAAALGNLFRRKGRLLLTQSVLIVAGVMVLVLMSLIASVNLTLDNEMARSRYAVRLGFSRDQAETDVVSLARSISPTRQVEVWQRLPMELSKDGKALRQKGSLGSQLLAIPVLSKQYRPLIEQGRWFQAADAGQRMLVLSADTAELNGIEAGDTLSVRLGPLSSDWQVIGLYRWLAGSGYTVEPVYTPLETAREITRVRDRASFAVVDAPIAGLAEESDYLRNLKQIFQENGIPLDVYTTQAKLEQRQFARNQFNPVIGTLLGLASMIVVVGGIGLSGVLAISVLQRIREIGVLRAIGAPSQAIYRLFLLEGLLQGLLAWLISAPLAYFAAEPIAAELGKIMLGVRLDFAFDYAAVGYWLGIVIVLSWTASFWPARKAARLTVRECFEH